MSVHTQKVGSRSGCLTRRRKWFVLRQMAQVRERPLLLKLAGVYLAHDRVSSRRMLR